MMEELWVSVPPSQVIAPDGSVRACASWNQVEAVLCEVDLQELRSLHTLRMHERRPDTYASLSEQENIDI